MSEIEEIGVEGVRKMLNSIDRNDYTLLDVRQPLEYEMSHLPGAVLIPLSELSKRFPELDPAKPTIVYCRSGNRSKTGGLVLKVAGFDRVFSMAGGITAWQGGVATGPYDAGLLYVKEKKDPVELAVMAWGIEDNMKRFYDTAASEFRASPWASEAFRTLSMEEGGHKASVIGVCKRLKNCEVKEEDLKAEAEHGLVEGGLKLQDLQSWLKTSGRTPLEAMEVALQLELNALDFFMKLQATLPSPEAKEIFRTLAESERAHLNKIGEIIGRQAGAK